MEKFGALLLAIGVLISFPDRLNKGQRQKVETFLISVSKSALTKPSQYFEIMMDQYISLFEATLDWLETFSEKRLFGVLLFLPSLIVSGIICIKYRISIGAIWLVAIPILISAYLTMYIFIALLFIGQLTLFLIYSTCLFIIFCLLKPGLGMDKLREKYGFVSTYGTLGWLMIFLGSILVALSLF